MKNKNTFGGLPPQENETNTVLSEGVSEKEYADHVARMEALAEIAKNNYLDRIRKSKEIIPDATIDLVEVFHTIYKLQHLCSDILEKYSLGNAFSHLNKLEIQEEK